MANREVRTISGSREEFNDLEWLMKKYNMNRSRLVQMLIQERVLLLKKENIDETQKKLPHTQTYDKRLKYSITINERADEMGYQDFKIDLSDIEHLLCNPHLSPKCYRCEERYHYAMKRSFTQSRGWIESMVVVGAKE